MSARPIFLITIDTEGDNAWSKPRDIATDNARYLPRFQNLCERFGLKPTYLTNWEMARCPAFQELGRDVLARGKGEVGMHLHAWNSPPLIPLTADDLEYQPYLVEYPETVLREKVRVMTETLEQTFSVKMLSHRAGRWALNETYARVLVELGYRVDCSVTPHVSWRSKPGDPAGSGGTDYSHFPDHAYLMDLDDISRPGASPLLELPMTIVRRAHPWATRGVRMLLRKSTSRLQWLRPNGRNLAAMLDILTTAVGERRPYVEFMLHSSELMPRGSPTFPTERRVETLYAHLEALFAAASRACDGMTLGEGSSLLVAART